ncbi:MAG: hypothetical protein GY810_18870 [Aureispira sp.]|nr:hypothetical protein [Aureispira sp.]
MDTQLTYHQKEVLILSLKDNACHSLDYLKGLSATEFWTPVQEKWSAGIILQHLMDTTAPVYWLMCLPPWLLKLFWGQSAQPARSKTELLKYYKFCLKKGKRSHRYFAPHQIKPSAQKQEQLLQKWERLFLKLTTKLVQWNMDDLINCQLPHSIMGKISVYEHLEFICWHTGHHTKRLKIGYYE